MRWERLPPTAWRFLARVDQLPWASLRERNEATRDPHWRRFVRALSRDSFADRIEALACWLDGTRAAEIQVADYVTRARRDHRLPSRREVSARMYVRPAKVVPIRRIA
jgi:hypothetical protein